MSNILDGNKQPVKTTVPDEHNLIVPRAVNAASMDMESNKKSAKFSSYLCFGNNEQQLRYNNQSFDKNIFCVCGRFRFPPLLGSLTMLKWKKLSHHPAAGIMRPIGRRRIALLNHSLRRMTSETFDGKKDPFGHAGQSDLYATFRPRYTPTVVQALLSRVNNRKQAVDIACGSGQLTSVGK